MRGTKAKRIRKAVYGDNAHSQRRYLKRDNGQILNTPGSLRHQYQAAKRAS